MLKGRDLPPSHWTSADRSNAPTDSYNLQRKRGPADYDRAQVFTPTLTWEIPYSIHNGIAARGCYTYNASNPDCTGLSGATAFQLIASASPTYGNEGRNILRSPGVRNVDFAICENFRFRGDGPKLQLRAEMSNAPDHIPSGGPSTNFSLASFGTITGNRGPRLIQFGLKLNY